MPIQTDQMKVAIVGAQGIPNNYGGFETLAEYLAEYLSKDFNVTVYCSGKDMPSRLSYYKGARLIYFPISSHGAMGIIYDSISLLHAVFNSDKVLFLGFGGGFIMPFLGGKRNKVYVNIGGLDWQRDKWSAFTKRVIKQSESILLRYCQKIIADNEGIANYIKKTYQRDSYFIAYGGDQVRKVEISEEAKLKYTFLDHSYAFNVARIQKDNHIEMMIEAFLNEVKLPLVIVGNWNSSKYGQEIRAKYQNFKNVILLDAIYNQELLNLLRGNCTIYIHGHSAGGTNPSLVEAMSLGLVIFAYSSGYNEFTTFNKAKYFSSTEELKQLVDNFDSLDINIIKLDMQKLAEKYYRWSNVAGSYKKILLS